MISVAADLAAAFADAPEGWCPWGALCGYPVPLASQVENRFRCAFWTVRGFMAGFDGEPRVPRVSIEFTPWVVDNAAIESAYRLGCWFRDGQRAARAIEALGRWLGGER